MRTFLARCILSLFTLGILILPAIGRQGTSYTGLRFGISPDAARETFRAARVALTEIGPGSYKFDKPAVPIEGVRDGYLSFRNQKLYRISLTFDRGERWSSLERSYRSVKSRVDSKYGPPSSTHDKLSYLESIRKVERSLFAWWEDDGVTISLGLQKIEPYGTWYVTLSYEDDVIAKEKEDGL